MKNGGGLIYNPEGENCVQNVNDLPAVRGIPQSSHGACSASYGTPVSSAPGAACLDSSLGLLVAITWDAWALRCNEAAVPRAGVAEGSVVDMCLTTVLCSPRALSTLDSQVYPVMCM